MGCDTTSRLYRLGKVAALKLITKNSKFLELARVFSSSTTAHDNIIRAGEKALVILYNGCQHETFDITRYKRYTEKVKKAAKAVAVKTLPPTSAAAQYHSLHVFFQISEWKGEVTNLEPAEWG